MSATVFCWWCNLEPSQRDIDWARFKHQGKSEWEEMELRRSEGRNASVYVIMMPSKNMCSYQGAGFSKRKLLSKNFQSIFEAGFYSTIFVWIIIRLLADWWHWTEIDLALIWWFNLWNSINSVQFSFCDLSPVFGWMKGVHGALSWCIQASFRVTSWLCIPLSVCSLSFKELWWAQVMSNLRSKERVEGIRVPV